MRYFGKPRHIRCMGVAVLGAVLSIAANDAAQAQRVEFQNLGTVKFLSKECGNAGWPTSGKLNLRFRYRPPDLGSNPEQTAFAIFSHYTATSYILASGRLTGGLKDVDGFGISAIPFNFPHDVKMRFARHKPSTLKTSTKKVKIAGEIRGFFVDGCRVKISGKLDRR